MTSNYRVEVDEIEKEEWSKELLQFNDATIYQTWSYGAIHWGEKNINHITIKKKNKVIGLAQVSIKQLPIIRAGVAFIPWGPIWRLRENEINLENFQYLITSLIDEYVKKRGLFLIIKPNEIEEMDNGTSAILKDLGFQKNNSEIFNRTFLIDLSPSLEELRKGLKQKWRNQLNRAEKNNLTVFEGSEDHLFKIFLRLQKEMRDRKGFIPGVDYDEFRMIQKDLPENLKMKIMICEFENQPIAAAICSVIGNKGIYLLGATGKDGLRLNGSNLLQWQMIKWMKEKKCLWYDLGGINPEKNPGVYRFKAGIAGKNGNEIKHTGQFELCQNSWSSSIFKLNKYLYNNYNKLKEKFNKIKDFQNESKK